MNGMYGLQPKKKATKKKSEFSLESLVSNASEFIFGNPSSKPTANFQTTNAFEKRKLESSRVMEKYRDKIPIICEVSASSQYMIELDKHKYLVPADMTVAQFLYVVRTRLRQNHGSHNTKLTPDVGLFLFTESNTLPQTSQIMSQIYKENRNKDGFLYFTVSIESTFG